MKKHLRSMWTLGTFAAVLTVGISLNAQSNSTPQSSDPSASQQSQPSQPTDPTAQQPSTPTQAQPNQTPDQGGQAAPNTPGQASPSQATTSASDSQTFSGTIVKAGDKYVLQDAASGKSYDIDHQDQVKQYEGKKVRVHGTLDASGKIHLQ